MDSLAYFRDIIERAKTGGVGIDDIAFANAEIQWRIKARKKQIPPDGDWIKWFLCAGRWFGKALKIDTPIPTPSGWTTMGELRTGDQVLDDQGFACRVVRAHPIMLGRPCYKLTFSDGATVVCDADHLWRTVDKRTRKAVARRVVVATRARGLSTTPRYFPRIVTTGEIAATLLAGSEANHSIENAKPLQLPERDLPLDPYFLGMWLGNGTSTSTGITTPDSEVMDRIREAGYLVRARTIAAGKCPTYGVALQEDPHGKNTILTALRVLGVSGTKDDKHIPADYLRASERQRRDLLCGLMDSDGHSTPEGHVEFCSTTKALADGVFELALSLGSKPAIYEGRAMLEGRDCGPRWRVCWTPHEPVFKTKRKLERQKFTPLRTARSTRRQIVACDRVESVPVRCITVDSPSSLYLCSRWMIPTHNTDTGANWCRFKSWTMPGSIGHAIAPTGGDLRRVMFEGPAGLLKAIPSQMIRHYRATPMPELTLTNGSQINGLAADTPDRIRGPQSHYTWCDELAAWQHLDEAWSNVIFSTRLPWPARGTQILITTTPKPLPLLRDLMADPDCRVVVGSSYENRANVSPEVVKEVMKYEGTKLGDQEIHGKLLDLEASGIISRAWIRIWPAKKALPVFDKIILSLDTAFTEETFDKKALEADPTGCSTWGLFTDPATKKVGILLLDCWEKKLGMPELIEEVKLELKKSYGATDKPLIRLARIGPEVPDTRSGRKIDLVVIEEKGSGISLRQMLARERIFCWGYNPGKADKLQRLHAVSHAFRHGYVWAVETGDLKRPGQPTTWAEPLISQVCSYYGERTIRHDDLMDTATQAIRYLLDTGHVQVSPAPKPDEDGEDVAKLGYDRVNPYGV